MLAIFFTLSTQCADSLHQLPATRHRAVVNDNDEVVTGTP